MTDLHNRRTFLRAAVSASAGWVVADLVQVEDALLWAEQQSKAGGAGGFSVLTPAQAEAIDALTSRILPSVDGRAGAHEAGVVHFIDRSLATFNASRKTAYRNGVTDLNRRAARHVPGAKGFASLTAVQQDDVLREIEKTPFFGMARFDTIVGTFALPSWGGNRDHMGWHMLGLDHQPAFQPPFGYYDADATRRT